MTQPWITNLGEPQPAHAAESKRGLWFWVKQTCLFPFRLLGLLLVLTLLIGGVSMWVIPNIAAQHEVDQVLLVLRILDDEGPARPFRRLNYQERILDKLLELRPGDSSHPGESSPESRRKENLRDEVVAAQAKQTAGGYSYAVRFASGRQQQLTATTPHTTVPRAELAEARRGVSRFFPPHDHKKWEAVLAWGESLFVTSWLQKYNPEAAPLDRFAGPSGGTEDEQLWCIWQVLRSGGAPAEDLDRLPELFRQAFPATEDRDAALAWAGTLLQRLEVLFSSRREDYRVSAGSKSGREGVLSIYGSFKQVLPPDTEWTRLWLLQQYVGLSPAARQAARQRWLDCFPASQQEQVHELGETLAEERRTAEPLPNAPEVVPVLCVIERLTGTDPDGQACCDAMARLPARKLLQLALQLAYPNDDLFYLLASGDPLELYPISGGRGEPNYYLAIVLFVLALTVLLALGVRTTLDWFAAPLLLGKTTRPLWEKHHDGRGSEPWWGTALGVLLLAGVGCLMARNSISELISVQVDSTAHLFLGSLMATAFGGVLIAIIRRILALFLIACGVDVEETWADEILGVLGGGFVLYHFGNDLFSIALYALSDIVPGLLFAGLHRLRGRPEPESKPPAEQPVARAEWWPSAR
ncbi:MAG: hypothetical protein HYS12_02990 [Planctomycetes bacterium]|nr:hypothetical protein [Planctomycetota bacterium]